MLKAVKAGDRSFVTALLNPYWKNGVANIRNLYSPINAASFTSHMRLKR